MARPRSAAAHEKVMQAALQLFSERGIEGTSIDAIAALSRVSKATIYKHWTDKDALCLDVLSRVHLPVELDTRSPPARSIREELIAVLSYQPPAEQQRLQERLRPHLMAYAVRNTAFGNAWRQQVTEPPRRAIKELLTRAIEVGELSPDLPFDIAETLLLGPMFYRKIFEFRQPPSPTEVAASAVNAFWRAYERSA